ncbi:hypothetical protein APUTEX25_005678, partial [Auxenochlorella protothecoides]
RPPMDMGVDLGPSEGPGHLGNSVMQLLGPGYLDALGLLSGHGGGLPVQHRPEHGRRRAHVYLGGYECEEHAAEAYDIAALKCKGRRGCKTNFDLTKYADLLGCINRMTMEELVMAVRRQSQGFSRGTSSFRGVTHHPSGRWEARIGVPGSKHIYLGLFIEEREAAKAYDRALVRLRGRGAATNFALGGSSENIGGGMLLPAPAGSESKTPMPCPSYSHATASSGQH